MAGTSVQSKLASNAQLTTERRGELLILALSGDWRIVDIVALRQLLIDVSVADAKQVVIDGAALGELDTATAAILIHVLEEKGFRFQDTSLEGFKDSPKNIIELTSANVGSPSPLRRRDRHGLLATLGRGVCNYYHTVKVVAGFMGQTLVEMAKVIGKPSLLRTNELFVQLEEVGVNAIAIVSLVTFLIGIVIAYLFGIQIEKYGANIFVVDAVSLTICRELSPILVAIIVAGRSGSAFTAHIGSMKLNEEIDAMQTLGLSPVRVLVLPRIFALMIAMPLLVFVGDIVGILGSMLIADLRLGITGPTFINRLQTVVPLRSFLVGLVKAPVFAIFIASIGCRLGMSVENNARSVGLSTTATVVRSIVAVILLNAAFAVLFVELGI